MKDKKKEHPAATDKKKMVEKAKATRQNPRRSGRGKKRKADESFQLSHFMDEKVILPPSLSCTCMYIVCVSVCTQLLGRLLHNVV